MQEENQMQDIQEESQENETSTTENKQETGVEATTQDTEKQTEETKNKLPGWFQERIDKVTAKRYEAERRAAKAEQLIVELSTRNQKNTEEHEGASATNSASKVSFTQAEIDRLTEEKARSLAASIASAEKFAETCNKVLDDGKKDFQDFDNSIKILNSMGAIAEDGTQNPTKFLETVVEFPDSHKLLDYLAKNQEETAHLLKLSYPKQVRELAKIEANLSKPISKPVSSAPDPIRPVHGAGKSSPTLEDKELSMPDWLKLREKELERKRANR